jgi:nitrogen-specific signal transduction histidine kinase
MSYDTVHNYIVGLKLVDEQMHESITRRRAAYPDFQPKYNYPFVFDKECRVLFAGFLGAEQMGRLPADMEGKRWHDLGLPPTVVEPFEKEIQSVFLTGRPVIKDLPGGYCGKLDTIHIEYMLNPLYNSRSKIGAVVCEVRDITEYEQMRREMARLDRLNLIGEMAAGVAHEIRNPMTVIKGYLQFLQTKVPESINEQFERVICELTSVEAIITDFLSLAKTKVDKQRQQNLNKIVQAIGPLIHSDAINKGINVEMLLDAKIPDVYLNDKEIRQLILNLARNGLEAMNKGTLTIETVNENDLVRLRVSDCGCGIPKEVQAKIFDPFFTTKSNGTGLGLSVCAGIVQRHGGRIDIQSEEGRGTTINVLFPINSNGGGGYTVF